LILICSLKMFKISVSDDNEKDRLENK